MPGVRRAAGRTRRRPSPSSGPPRSVYSKVPLDSPTGLERKLSHTVHARFTPVPQVSRWRWDSAAAATAAARPRRRRWRHPAPLLRRARSPPHPHRCRSASGGAWRAAEDGRWAGVWGIGRWGRRGAPRPSRNNSAVMETVGWIAVPRATAAVATAKARGQPRARRSHRRPPRTAAAPPPSPPSPRAASPPHTSRGGPHSARRQWRPPRPRRQPRRRPAAAGGTHRRRGSGHPPRGGEPWRQRCATIAPLQPIVSGGPRGRRPRRWPQAVP